VELIDQSGAGGFGVDDDDDMPDGCWYVPWAGTANWGFFFIYMGVRASLRAPQLIPRLTEHPANPVGM